MSSSKEPTATEGSAAPQNTISLVLPDFGHSLILEESPLPAIPSPGSVFVRILSASVRPHNRLGFTGKGPLSFPVPYTPGVMAIGRVVSRGPDLIALQPDQLVFINGFTNARDDPDETQVILGLTDLDGATKRTKLFNAWKGFWSNVAIVPAENCFILDESVLTGEMGYSYADLNYIERLAVAYGGISAAELTPGDTAIAAPATGHYSGAVAELAAQIGCRVIALSRSSAKLAPLTSRHPRITELELTGDEERDLAAIQALCPRGVDAYIDTSPPEATSSPAHFSISMMTVKSGGRVILLGSMLNVAVNYLSLMTRNITVKGQFMYNRAQLLSLIRMIETGIVKLGKDAGHEIVGRGFALQDWKEATLAAETATKWGQQVVLTP